jgi:hypothetical protein
MARMGETDMLDPFDIFKMEQNGTVSWVRATSDFEHAKSYVNTVLAVATPADYLILNQRTGERIIIEAATKQRDCGLNIDSATVSSAA